MDKQQLTAQFLANRHGLFGFIYGFIRNTHDAEDIVQEVWMRFSSALERGVNIHEPARWCRGAAKNLILHYWRDHKNAKVIADQDLFELVELAFFENDSAQEIWQTRQRALAECIGQLPDKSKRLVSLRYDAGHSMAKMAELLNQSAESIMMALSRIRRSLRECAEAKLKSPDFG